MTDEEKLMHILDVSNCLYVYFLCSHCPIKEQCGSISIHKDSRSMTSLRRKFATEKLDDIKKIEKIESILNRELSE